MAQSFDSEFGRLVRPGAYPSVKVQTTVSGLASTGVIALIGEADGGMPGADDDISLNYFGPDEFASVVRKYASGPLVDGFRAAVEAANDAGIIGSVSRVFLYKTNASTKASCSVANSGIGTFGTVSDLNYGRNGNMIYWKALASQAESAPATGGFTFIPSPLASEGALRVSGGSKQTFAIGAKALPSVVAATLDGLDDILCQGGVNRAVLAGLSGINIEVAASGDNITVSLAVGSVFAATPQVGDTLIIAAAADFGAVANSVIKGGLDKNYGQYVVTGVINTLASAAITATKLRNNAAGALIAPENAGPAAISANLDDIMVFSSLSISDVSGADRGVLNGLVTVDASATAVTSTLTFTLDVGSVFAATPQVGDIVHIPLGSAFVGGANANVGYYEVTSVSNTVSDAHIVMSRLSNGDPATVGVTAIVAITDLSVYRPVKSGLAKTLEIFDNEGTDPIDTEFYGLGLTTPVAWLSEPADAYLLTSGAEFISEFNVNRQLDNIQESIISGGAAALKVGYLGTSATLTVGATTITTTVVGGVGGNLSLTKADYPTLSDLAAYIDAQPGYSAAVGSVVLNSKSPDDLDLGTYGICAEFSAESQPGRIKRDLADFSAKIAGSALVSFEAVATAGLPEPTSAFAYLSGGAKGGTSPARVLAGVTALEGVEVNFVVPLFSRDATADITDGLTDSTSTYTVASVHSSAKSHVLAMSQVKRRKNRQAFLGFQGTFTGAKESAAALASARVALCFQDVKRGAADGSVKQFQPWVTAAIAAGMQAAGFYKSITKKYMNCSGVLQAAGDFADNNDSQVEDALLSGLLPAEKVASGGYRWLSDQTTYGQDSNFVYNSVQAVYIADVVALSLATRMESAFVGQTLGDVTAAAMLGYIQAVMSEYRRLKLIAPSDDAATGYKNVIVRIQGPVAFVSLEIKLAGALYFIPISFTVSQVTQTAAV